MKIGWATTTNTFQLVVVVLVIYFIAIAKCQTTTENLQLIQDEFCSKNVNHTFCLHLGKISENCGKVTSRGLDEAEKRLATQLHNQLRAQVARGEEIRGHPGPQPSASNMMQMVWDNELELEAQTWADQCIRDHDCPECRTLDRFKVGQNLYWFGYLSGSWEVAVNGWYDEVADFNSSFVFPFYVIRGVLVGHYTQLAWAQTWRIGCGKITYQPEGENGQQLYICNYGLAGNLIRSEMYKIGEPCAECPLGTECSVEYPGLCSGFPEQPLTIRPPVILPGDFPGWPEGQTPATDSDGLIVPEVFEEFINPPLFAVKNSSCIHQCKPDGGCSVRIESNALISGPTLGSCFPPSFGGSCSGIPENCTSCIEVCEGHNGKEIVVHLDEEGNDSDIDIRPLVEETDNSVSIGGESAISNSAQCIYNCQLNGGCSVKIQSDVPVSGNTLGSCFSQTFGGECSGIPEKCENCNIKCEGRTGEEFSENV